MRRHSYRLELTKLDEAGFLSHRNLIGILEQVLIRSGFTVHTSGGRKWPSPKISLLHPLPVGVESVREVAFFKLRDFVYPSRIQDVLSEIPFPGLDLLNVFPQSKHEKPAINELTFEISFDEAIPSSLQSTVREILQNESECSGENNSAPEGVSEWTFDETACTYRTDLDQGPVHPENLIQWLRHAVQQPLPTVTRMIKTNMILKR